MWKDEGEKVFLNEEETLSLLPDGDYIHTFLNPGFGLVGADWERNELVEKIRNSNKLELAGPAARSMGHGLCVYSTDTKYHDDILFVETDEKRLAELEASINAG